GNICTTLHTCHGGSCTAPAKLTVFAGKPGGHYRYDYGRSDGPPTSVRFNKPGYIAKHVGGGYLVTDFGNNLIRHMSSDGWVTTVAGNPGGAGKTDGRGTAASFSGPLGIATRADGKSWICDYYNHRIRLMSPSFDVVTVAGSTAGFSDGQGPTTKFKYPYDVAVDVSGAALVADSQNNRIRRVTTTGKVTTFAGSIAGWVDGPVAQARFHRPIGLDSNKAGFVWVTEERNHSVRRISPTGLVETVVGRVAGWLDADSGPSSKLNQPRDVLVDGDGTLYIADSSNRKIRALFTTGAVRTLAGSVLGTADGLGKAGQMNLPMGLMLDGDTLLMADHGAHEIRKLKLARKLCDDNKPCTIDRCDPIAGCVTAPHVDGAACDDGKPCTDPGSCKAGACSPGKAIVGCKCTTATAGGCGDGNPCTTDSCDPLTGCQNTPSREGRPCDDGSKCTSGERCDGGTCNTRGSPWSSWVWVGGKYLYGDGWRLPTSTNQAYVGLGRTCGSDLDAKDNLWIADCSRHSIRVLSPDGTLTTVAGPNANLPPTFQNGSSTAARFHTPQDVAVALDGSAYVADSNNHRIRKIDAKHAVTTWAGQKSAGFLDGKGEKARFKAPHGVAVDPVGTVYVADYGNFRLRKIAPDAEVTTLAGNSTSKVVDGVGATASFGNPLDVAIAPDGKLYVADTKGPSIRRVTPAGEVHTILHGATSGTIGGLGIYGTRMSALRHIDVDKSGAIYFVDEAWHRVFRMSPGGMVTTLAGDGSKGSVSGLGAKAKFYGPRTVQRRANGQLYVTAYNGYRMYMLERPECNDHNRCTLDKCDPKSGCTHPKADPKLVCDDNGPCRPATCDVKVGRCQWKARPNGEVCGDDCNLVCTDGACAASALATTWLGNGAYNFKAGKRSEAQVGTVYGMAENDKGEVYFSDGSRHLIGKVDSKDTVTLLAGANGKYGYQEGVGGAARFYGPRGITFGDGGALIIADTNNHRIRQMTPSNVVSTRAGSSKGFKDATSTLARFNAPTAVSYRKDGVIAVADSANRRVRAIDKSGKVTTLAGSTLGTEDGPVSVARFYSPNGVQWGDNGALFVLDSGAGRIRRIAGGEVITIAGWGGQGFYGRGRMVSGLGSASGFVRLADGRFVVTNRTTDRVKIVTPNGEVIPLAGSSYAAHEGLGPDARFKHPVGVLVRKNGELLVGTQGSRIHRLRTKVSQCAALRGISAAQAAASCQQINKTFSFDDVSTVWVDPDGVGGDAPFATQCDLSTDGGGWTRITEKQSPATIDKLLGGHGQVMYKCTSTGAAHIISPLTKSGWSWSKKTALPGDWQISAKGGPAAKVSCGADAGIGKLPCGWGFACATAGTFVLPGVSGVSQCSNTQTVFTGGPMGICGKSNHSSWAVFVRKKP
ncbi:MAG: hypothetical protein KC502_12660, partial [Myxococcales bacterium]|nr:hypothetical protein [Myxococcales bacterium]